MSVSLKSELKEFHTVNLRFGIKILSRLDQFTVQKCQNWALLKWFYSLFWPSVKLCGMGKKVA